MILRLALLIILVTLVTNRETCTLLKSFTLDAKEEQIVLVL